MFFVFLEKIFQKSFKKSLFRIGKKNVHKKAVLWKELKNILYNSQLAATLGGLNNKLFQFKNVLLFRKLLAALKKKKKPFHFSFCKSFVDFVATIMKMMLFSLRARHCKYFGTKDFSNKKIKQNKQREKQEFCTKPKNSKTAKTM